MGTQVQVSQSVVGVQGNYFLNAVSLQRQSLQLGKAAEISDVLKRFYIFIARMLPRYRPWIFANIERSIGVVMPPFSLTYVIVLTETRPLLTNFFMTS